MADTEQSAVERIGAISDSDELSPREKRDAIRAARADETALAGDGQSFPMDFTFGDVVVTLLSAPTAFGVSGVQFLATATRAGVAVDMDPHHIVINPPIKFVCEDGDQETTVGEGEAAYTYRWREDPLACLALAVSEIAGAV